MKTYRRFVMLLLALAVVAQAPVALAQIAGQPTTGGVPIGYANGPTIVPSNSGGTVDFDSAFVNKPTEVKYRSAAGTITATSNGPTSADITAIEGQYTRATDIVTNGNQLTLDPQDKAPASVDGGVTQLRFQQASGIDVGDGANDFSYAASSSGTITLNNLPSNNPDAVTDTGQPLGELQVDASGTATIDADGTNGQLVGVKLFQSAAPTIDNSQATPNKTQTILKDPPLTLSVPVDDADFSGYGDTLTVRFYVDGNQISSTQLASAGTPTATVSSITGGQHTWHVEVEDGYGNSVESDTFDLKVPDELSIRSESNPGTLLTGQGSANVTFFGSDETYTRSTSNGNVSFDGLPVTERFVAEVETDGYISRTVVIPSLLEQRNVYLLDNSTTTVQVRFRLNDATGTFSETSFIVIERPLEFGNETRYEVVVSDEVGVAGLTTQLKKDERYQIKVRNRQGDVSQLGKFDALLNESVTLEPSAAAVQDEQTDETLAYTISYNADVPDVDIEVADPRRSMETLTVGIRYRNGTTIRAPQTYSDTSTLSLSEPLQSEIEQPAVVVINGTRASGEEINIREPIGPEQRRIVPTTLSPVWVQIGAGFTILLIGGVFSVLNVAVGAVITSLFAGVLWFLGIMSGVASGASIALAIGISTLNLLLKQ